jgi:hypothetical protein
MQPLINKEIALKKVAATGFEPETLNIQFDVFSKHLKIL